MAGGCFGKCHSPLIKKHLGSYGLASLASVPEKKMQQILLNIIFGQMRKTKVMRFTHSVNTGMKVDVICLAFSKALNTVSQRIFTSCLERYGLCMWKTSWTASLKEFKIKGQSVTSNASKCSSWYWYCLTSALRNKAQPVTVCYQHTAGSRNHLGHRASRRWTPSEYNAVEWCPQKAYTIIA